LQIIALYSIKGGVGKTTAAVNLSFLAAQDGLKTLLIDLDPQGAASFYYKVRSSSKLKTKALLKGKNIREDTIKATDYENLDILPADLSFRKMDTILNNLKNSKRRLKRVLPGLAPEYQLIFLDCPPSLTLVSENIFQAADFLLIPLIPTTLSLLTYEKLIQFFKKQKLAPEKIIAFFSMAENRKKIHREIMSTMWQTNPQLLKNHIPYLSEIEKMGLHREPLACYSPNSKANAAYLNLWNELKGLLENTYD